MPNIRPPAVAGSFYPDNPNTLASMIESYLEQAEPVDKAPKAMIVPHAGYIYSGACAATAYARLQPGRSHIKRVILLGPSHKIGFTGFALSHAEAFRTPLGNIPLDTNAIASLAKLPFVEYLEQAHEFEHSLEVQLPFLQMVLDAFYLIPIVVGDCPAEQIEQLLELFYGTEGTLIIISSDLSHFHDYATAQRLDRETSDKIERLDYLHLNYDSACGRVPVSGLLSLAQKKSLQIVKPLILGIQVILLEIKAVLWGMVLMLLTSNQQQLMRIAKDSIAYGLEHGIAVPINYKEFVAELQAQRATFVTLEIKHQLRGCIGMLEAIRPLIVDVAENAFAAAFRDPRFPPVTTAEYSQLEIHLSILSAAEPMSFYSEEDLVRQLRPGVDGLIMQEGGHRGTFLPSVWESLAEPGDFLLHLKQKSGLASDYWSDSLKVSRYECEYISET